MNKLISFRHQQVGITNYQLCIDRQKKGNNLARSLNLIRHFIIEKFLTLVRNKNIRDLNVYCIQQISPIWKADIIKL